MPIEQSQITWAVEAFGDTSLPDYPTLRSYYQGNHNLSFATPKFNQTFGTLFKSFAYNRCRTVVDSLANGLRVSGFSINGIDVGNLALMEEPGGEGNDLSQKAWTLWKLGNMPLREGELYVEAGITGDAFGVVWFDADPPLGTGLPRIWPNRAEIMRVQFDDDGRITLAAKSWMITAKGEDEKKRRLTFYTPTEIVKLITTGKSESGLKKNLGDYELVQEVNLLGQPMENPILHNLGAVPVVHYPNNAPMVGERGISELKDVVPLQDALNKAIADMLVAMEYSAFPQRWATGIETPEEDEDGNPIVPWKPGPGNVWYSSEDGAKFGDFTVGDLSKFLDVQNQFDMDISRVSGIPVHYLMMNGNFPSGEALKTAESPFTAKKQDRQNSYGNGHSQAMLLQFKMLGISDPLLIETQWEPAEPRVQGDLITQGLQMVQAGLPVEIAAKHMGLDEQDLLALQAASEEQNASRATAIEQIASEQMTQQLIPEG